MAEHRTTRLGLRYGDWRDVRPDVQITANWLLLDRQAALGSFAVVVAEVPSTSLRVIVRGGTYADDAGALHTLGDFAATTLPASSTRALWLDDAGALQVGAAFPAPGGGRFVPLAVVTTDATTVTAVQDARHPSRFVGS